LVEDRKQAVADLVYKLEVVEGVGRLGAVAGVDKQEVVEGVVLVAGVFVAPG
jgi:hypothetical protein